jgi:hypothetical protein
MTAKYLRLALLILIKVIPDHSQTNKNAIIKSAATSDFVMTVNKAKQKNASIEIQLATNSPLSMCLSWKSIGFQFFSVFPQTLSQFVMIYLRRGTDRLQNEGHNRSLRSAETSRAARQGCRRQKDP